MLLTNLEAQRIPLTGVHLIEASAGTGKTFNITRIYLRLLLERRLPVEQILVMTFTKDATEELRGRIDSFIRQAINHWPTLIEKDEYFAAIAEKINQNEALILLKKALLYLDEAAIYTIHGFCKRVLSQHAFTSGLSFEAQMESDCQDLVIESCQDWYRVLAQQSTESFLLLAEFWPEPQSFLNNFSKAIAQTSELALIEVDSINEHFQNNVKSAHFSLTHHFDDLVRYLVDVKKGPEREVRLQELNALVQWLINLTKTIDINDTLAVINNQVMPDSFIDGRRYGRSKFKTEIIEIFTAVIEVKERVKSIQVSVNKAKAFAIVRQGIYKIRAEIISKKQQQNMLSFDDLIATLAQCLSPELDHDTRLAQTLLTQYPVALVDEFQDTDPQQFAILQAIYFSKQVNPIVEPLAVEPQLKQAQNQETSHAINQTSALYMIGDPKQAIYGFRGGDVFAYLAARADCQYQWLMDTNWRSTKEMVEGYNRLFYGNCLTQGPSDVFGYDIPYLPVNASPKALALTCPATDDFSALQFIHFSGDTDEQSNDKAGAVKQHFRPIMANWCADEIVRLLTQSNHQSHYQSHHQSKGEQAEDGNQAKLRAQDIAILVRDGTEAKAIKEALHSRALASVYLSNRANLFHSTQTSQLVNLLKGILFVENERLYTAALACGLLGFTPKKLYQLQQDELAWQNLKFTFSALRDEWIYKGFISMALKLMHQHFHISEIDQDRILTNLLHLFEILQSASQRHRQPQELLYWFEQQAQLDNPESEAELRLESDDDLIRIITQHGSKGLEYPIVFVPFATRHKDPLRFGNRAVNFIEYHDQDRKLLLSLDGSAEAKKAMADEAYAEAIRLLYVAVTRAERRCYILTTEFEQCYQSPLGLTLKWQKDQPILPSLLALVADNPDAIGVHQVNHAAGHGAGNDNHDPANSQVNYQGRAEYIKSVVLYQPPINNLEPIVATFTGKIERDWWLSSFTALSKNLRHGGVSAPDRDNDLLQNSEQSQHVVSHLLRFNIAKGPHTGNLLHDILEHTDFSQPDWLVSMKWPLVKYGELPKGFTDKDLQRWLLQILNSPLKQANCCLADLSLAQSLRETEFYFPMESASSRQLTQLLTKHRARSNKTNVEYAVTPVKLPAYHTLKGMMHGFIDLIFEHQGKFFVCDYKSSHLGEHYQYYGIDHIQKNIEDHYYDLQYLIYSLALHRYLKHALPDYDPVQHFGGIYYLYLRGMTDDVQHQGAGVYYRQITVKELDDLDDIFSGRVPVDNPRPGTSIIAEKGTGDILGVSHE